MIKYSLSYRNVSVKNADGTTSKKALAYAKAQDSGALSASEFAEICAETSIYGAGVLASVMSIIAKKIIDYAKNSYRVEVGDIGVFGPAVSSKGVDDIADFTPTTHITKSYISLARSRTFNNLDGVSYGLTDTRDVIAAARKANKDLATAVNLGDSTAKAKARAYLESQA